MLVNMHEAKSRLSELVRQVAGRLRERIVVASDFDATPEDVLAAFDGGR